MNPGSPEAVRQGCTCPVLDNAHGRGRGDGSWWISEDCPVHPSLPLGDFEEPDDAA